MCNCNDCLWWLLSKATTAIAALVQKTAAAISAPGKGCLDEVVLGDLSWRSQKGPPWFIDPRLRYQFEGQAEPSKGPCQAKTCAPGKLGTRIRKLALCVCKDYVPRNGQSYACRERTVFCARWLRSLRLEPKWLRAGSTSPELRSALYMRSAMLQWLQGPSTQGATVTSRR